MSCVGLTLSFHDSYKLSRYFNLWHPIPPPIFPSRRHQILKTISFPHMPKETICRRCILFTIVYEYPCLYKYGGSSIIRRFRKFKGCFLYTSTALTQFPHLISTKSRVRVRVRVRVSEKCMLQYTPSDHGTFELGYRHTIINCFYARKQNASRVFAIVWASVRLSVRPSVCLSVCHTRELYQNGAS